MERLQNIYNDLRDENELAIYDKYGKIAKRITIAFIGKNKIFLILINMIATSFWHCNKTDYNIKKFYDIVILFMFINHSCSKRENL